MNRLIFSNRLKSLRETNALSQKDFADKVGISTATLSAYENNQKNPTTPILCAIAETFDVSTDWLLGIEKKNTTKNTVGDVLSLFNDLFFSLNVFDAGSSQIKTTGDRILYVNPTYSDEAVIRLGEKIHELFILYELQKNETITLETYQIAANEIIEKNKTVLLSSLEPDLFSLHNDEEPPF